MENILEFASIALSVLAFFISVGNWINDKRKNISEIVSNERIKWIKDVRNLTALFLEKYIKGEDEKELKIIKSKIDLYIRWNSSFYQKYNEKLNHCIVNAYNEDDYKELTSFAQEVLNDVWVRIKKETGISIKDEKRIIKELFPNK